MGWNFRFPKSVRLISGNRFPGNVTNGLRLDKDVVVISIFGPSQFVAGINNGGGQGKKPFQIAVDVFGSLKLMSNTAVDKMDSDSDERKELTTINGIYNEDEGVIILCLDGAFDANICLEAFQVARTGGLRFMNFWLELKCSYSKLLLLLFSISHVMILSNVGPYFDTGHIGLFQALERFRHEMQPYIRDVLKLIPGLPDAWVKQGRICSPRLLLFIPVSNLQEKAKQAENSTKTEVLKKLKFKLGDDVYKILRKCRIITNHSGNSLFALPMDDDTDFIFVYDESVELESDLRLYITKFCEASNERANSNNEEDSSPKLLLEQNKRREYFRQFKTFLLSHIRVARNGGFDDNAHRGTNEDRKFTFILPKLGDWMNVFDNLRDLLVQDSTGEESVRNDVLTNFGQYDTDSEYLEKQCNLHFHKVFSVYSKNLPAHYSLEEHTTRVNNAIDAFLKISTAPGIVPWLEKLTEKCDRFWKRGRQQCATRSLHRKLCVNPVHQVEPSDHLEVLPLIMQDDTLPQMKHSAGNRLTSYCNCGRRSGIRDDPFTIRGANFDFYDRLASECCRKLETYKFPVFEDNRKGEGLTLEEMLGIFHNKEPALQEEEDQERFSLETDLRQEEDDDEGDVVVTEVVPTNEDFGKKKVKLEIISLTEGVSGMGLSQNEIPDSLPPPLETNVVTRSVTATPTPTISPEVRREFLPGMVHSRCPDLLPLFPSWSLVRFGPANVYAHNAGILYQPDFLVGSAYLLPYDVRVKAPGVSKPIPRRISGKQPSKGTKRFEDVFNVKIFIGFEYECRKGHRFMLESPDNVLSINSPNFGPGMREAANKVANSDMPLYFKCPCNTHSSSVDQMFAQLMRIHVVTPKAPVFVQLSPKVQPGALAPYFFSGKDGLKLNPSGYWVLRLPFSYVSEDHIFSPPTSEDQDGFKGRIARGLFTVLSMTPAETLDWELKSNQ